MNTPLAVVTGAPGWLGSRLVECLLHGVPDVPALAVSEPRPVRCLIRRGDDPAALVALSRVECVTGDITAPESLAALFEGACGATVFHCAGVIHPSRVTEFEQVNAVGTRNLLQAACRARVRRFVHVSSNSPFGGNPGLNDRFDESAPFNPYMSYGRSKMLGEQAVVETGRSGTIETVVVRAPWFYGPGQPPRQTLFFTMIRRGWAPLVGSGENRRSMAYIDNLCQGLLLCEKVPRAARQVYWIADRRPYSMSEILSTVERVMERDLGLACAHGRLRLPGFASDVARLIDGALQSAGFYHQKIHVLSEMNMTIACDIAKAERELGFDPKIELEEGMRRSLLWLRERGIEP